MGGIKIGSEKYNYRGYKSPLEYYEANLDKYKEMGRYNLSKKDPGFYRTLSRHKLLDELFPIDKLKLGRPRTSNEDIMNIILNFLFEENIAKTARRCKVSTNTVFNYLRASGILS